MNKQFTAPDFAAIKAKQQTAWSSGDYAVVGTTIQIVGETLCEAINLRSGTTVLDVAAGNGNATLAAARRYADVTSTDYVPSLLERGQLRAAAEGLTVRFQTADAEALPFAEESFEVTLSTFGVMFTPDQETAAAELARVTQKGGIIAMANWSPEGFIGQVFKTLGKHIPPAPGVKSPALWGDQTALELLFAGKASSVETTKKQFAFRYQSFDHFIDVFRTYYGPVHKAFIALGENGQALEDDLRELAARFNVDGPDGFVVPSEYSEVIIRK